MTKTQLVRHNACRQKPCARNALKKNKDYRRNNTMSEKEKCVSHCEKKKRLPPVRLLSLTHAFFFFVVHIGFLGDTAISYSQTFCFKESGVFKQIIITTTTTTATKLKPRDRNPCCNTAWCQTFLLIYLFICLSVCLFIYLSKKIFRIITK